MDKYVTKWGNLTFFSFCISDKIISNILKAILYIVLHTRLTSSLPLSVPWQIAKNAPYSYYYMFCTKKKVNLLSSWHINDSKKLKWHINNYLETRCSYTFLRNNWTSFGTFQLYNCDYIRMRSIQREIGYTIFFII